MVFGNMGDDSGTGVAFTRNPANGDPAPYGDYLVNAQGEDVAPLRNHHEVAENGRRQPRAWEALQEHMQPWRPTTALWTASFTVEKGRWALQKRIGKGHAGASGLWPTTCRDE